MEGGATSFDGARKVGIPSEAFLASRVVCVAVVAGPGISALRSQCGA